MIYLTHRQLRIINSEIQFEDEFIDPVRDENLLHSAAERPKSSAFGQDAYPTIYEKTAALLESIARNHPFVDGNKRTATTASIVFLKLNGHEPNWQKDDAYQFIMGVSQGRYTIEAIASWLRQNTIQR